MQSVINKLLWKNRYAGYYFMTIMKYSVFRKLIMNYFSRLNYKYRTECFYHVRKYINEYKGIVKPGLIELYFDKKRIKIPYQDKSFGGAFALLLHDIEVKQTYIDIINNSSISVFYDVGANSGYHSLIISSQGVDVMSFEPNKYCEKRYVDMFSINQFNANWIGKAVGNKEEKLILNFNKDETYLGFLNTEKLEHYEGYEVDVITLDDFCKKNRYPDLLKIDTEGYELEVLRGAQQLISNNKPFILFEQLEADVRNWVEIVDFFKLKDYKIITLPLDHSSIYLNVTHRRNGNFFAFHSSKEHVIKNIIESKYS